MNGNSTINGIAIILVALFLGAIGYAVFSGQSFLVSQENDSGQEISFENLPELEIIKPAPEIAGIESWINAEPLSLLQLRGKVVLIDFWTYSCINCIRTLPHVQGWYEKYKDNGFVVLGVHTPEFEFEKNRDNVIANVEKYDLKYPVALDNDYRTWRAFENRFWPAHYLIDAMGNIRYTHFGEGRYAATEQAIQSLLLEAGLLQEKQMVQIKEQENQVDFEQIGTPELYLGASRLSNIGNPVEGVFVGQAHEFQEPQEEPQLNQFYLAGTWRLQPEFVELDQAAGKIILLYKASKVNMVLESKNEIVAEVTLDGNYLNEQNKGEDVFFENGKSLVRIKEPRLYNLVDTADRYEMHTVEIIVPAAGLQAFTFTFG